MPRIIVIRNSLTAFVCGLIGVLPLIGVVPGVYALICWGRIRVRYRDEWNPASAYLSFGALFALLGLLSSALLVAVSVAIAIRTLVE
jgi:hypothetical protein